MLELMSIIMLINFICVGIALMIAKEKQYVPPPGKTAKSACGPLAGMCGACTGMPFAFYILLFVQAMVWMGNTVWGTYGKEWFTHSVYPGDPEAPEGSLARQAYIAGAEAFGSAGQIGSVFNLLIALSFFGLGFTNIPGHLIYSPCIFIGTFVCFLCAFVVGQSHTLALVAFVLSNVCLTAAGALPYGIVAKWNSAMVAAGKVGSVAMQMAVLNCCITVGQQLCTMILGAFETQVDLKSALKYLFVLSMIANGLGAVASLFLGGNSSIVSDTAEPELELEKARSADAPSKLASHD